MLVFQCSVQKSFRVGDVTLTVLQVRGDRVRIRVDAPGEVPVYKEEVLATLSDAASKALAGVRPAAL